MIKKFKQILSCILIFSLLTPDIARGMEFEGLEEGLPTLDQNNAPYRPRAKSLGYAEVQPRPRANSIDNFRNFPSLNRKNLNAEIHPDLPDIQQDEEDSEITSEGPKTQDQWWHNSQHSIELEGLVVHGEKPLPQMVPDAFKQPLVGIINLSPNTEKTHLTLNHPKTAFEHEFEELSEEDRMALCTFKKRILDQVPTWPEISAQVLGVVISAFTTVGMWPIMSQGLIYLKERYHWNWINTLEAGNANYALLVMTILFILPSALGRNTTLLKKVVTSLTETGIQTGRTLRTAIATLLPSMIPPFYLIELERHNMDVTHTVGFNNQFAIAATILGLGLLLDTWIANFDMAWEMETDLKEWVHSSQNHLSDLLAFYFFPRQIPCEEELIRQTFSKKLDALIHTLPKMEEKRRDEIYDNILKAQETIQRDIPSLQEKHRDSVELILVSRYLLACSEEAADIKRIVNPWPFIIVSVGLSAFMGTLALQLMGDVILQFTGTVLPQLGISRQFSSDFGWVFATFGLYPLAGFMLMGMNNFFKKFVPHESRIEQGLAMLAGALYTIPFGVMLLQACNKWWDDETWMIAAIPLIYAKFLTLSTFFCNAYHKAGTSVMKINNKLFQKKCTSYYKTNYLIEKIEEIKNRLPYFSGAMLHWLETNLKADG